MLNAAAESPTVAPPAGACPNCGTALSDDSAGGLCPRCLLSGGLFSEGPGSGGGNRFVPPGLEELAAHFPEMEVQSVLGRGGMGAVYRVKQLKLDRVVALKVLPPEVGRDPAFAERFLREARTLARLNHPHIVQVYDFGQTPGVGGEPGLFYFLMEYVDGANLRDVIAAAGVGATDPAKALEIVRQVCEALQFAHARGVVHRDVKPENILLDKSGTVKIADFGLAKLGRGGEADSPAPWTLTGTRQAMGTPHYMAPEQVRGTRDVDHRADIYSLGVVFYELLTGDLPVGRFAPPSKRGKSDARLDDVVMKALASEPADRYQSVTDVRTAVDSLGLPPDPATPEIGGLADAPHVGNVRVTVNAAASPPPLEDRVYEDVLRGAGYEPQPGDRDKPLEERVYDDFLRTAERQDRIVNGVFGGVGGVLTVGGLLAACLAAPNLHGSEQGFVMLFGLAAALAGSGLTAACGAGELAHRAGDPASRWSRLGRVLRDFGRSLWLPIGVGLGAAFLSAVSGARGETIVHVGVIFGVATLTLQTARRETPPAWWPGVWSWFGAPPLTPLPGAAPPPSHPAAPPPPPPAARPAPVAPAHVQVTPAPAADPDAPEARRATEVKRNLRVAGSLLTGLLGAGAVLGAAVMTAGLFVLHWSDDPLPMGFLILSGCGTTRMLAGTLLSGRPVGYEPGGKERRFGANHWKLGDGRWYTSDTSVRLVDLWDCGVTLLWTAAATAVVALPLAVVIPQYDYEAVVFFGVVAGLLAAGYVTLRRPTAPLWWPPGWAWKARGGGALAVFAPIAGWVGRLAIFHTPPGGLSRPALWGAVWLMTWLAIPVCLILRELFPPNEDPLKVLAVFLAVPAAFAPLAVPLLGWAGVRQVRASRVRGDDPPVSGRRLGVFCAWAVPAVLIVGAFAWAAAGAVAVWYWEFDGAAGLDRWEIDLHVGLAAVAGATVGLIFAGLLWFKLSRASRGPFAPPPRPAPDPGAPHDTGAGLSRVFTPKSKRDWTETLAAAVAVLAVLAAGGWWWAGSRPQWRPHPAVAGVEHGPPEPKPERPVVVPPLFTVTDGDLWEGRVDLTPGAARRLGLTAAEGERLTAAANAARRQWAEALAAETAPQVDPFGRVLLRVPDLTARAADLEAAFLAVADELLDGRELGRLREDGPLFRFDHDDWYRSPAGPPLCPAGTGGVNTLGVERRGDSVKVMVWAGGAHRYHTTFSDEIPPPLRFLIPAADRVLRDLPPFPPVAGDEP